MIQRKAGSFKSKRLLNRRKRAYLNDCKNIWYTGFSSKCDIDSIHSLEDLKTELDVHPHLYHLVPLPFQLLKQHDMLNAEVENKWIDLVEEISQNAIEGDFLDDTDDIKDLSMRYCIKLERTRKKNKFNVEDELNKIKQRKVSLYRRYALAYSLLPYLDFLLENPDEDAYARMHTIIEQVQKTSLSQSDIDLIEENIQSKENTYTALANMTMMGGEACDLFQLNYTWVKVYDNIIAPIFIADLDDLITLISQHASDHVTIYPLNNYLKKDIEESTQWYFKENELFLL